MIVDLFQHENYKKYLGERIELEAQTQRGVKQTISKAIDCQPSYLSQILYHKPHLTLEQASKINFFFNHGKQESKYFILLREHARAGTKDLQSYFSEQICELQQTRHNLRKRLKDVEEIREEDCHQYYSAWFYSAIHMMLAVPEFQDPNKIVSRLNLPKELVLGVIQFLEDCGLIIKNNGSYDFTKSRLHLKRESAFIQRHHINWRSQALQSAEKNLPDDLHYSSVIALSKKDYLKIKELLVKSIENARKIIGPSKEEDVCAITLDFFKL